MIEAAEQAFGGVNQQLKQQVSQQTDRAMMDLRGYANTVLQRVAPQGTLGNIISPTEKLRAMMGQQPYTLPAISNPGQLLRLSSDQFVIGQFFLQDRAPGQALQWFGQSAAQPGGYGILSQLTLADIYRNGGHGVEANPSAAMHYYKMAQQSLSALQVSGSPESKQLLGSLPAPPAQLQSQLQESIQRLQ